MTAPITARKPSSAGAGPNVRSKTRTETDDELRSIAEATRTVAEALDQLYTRVNVLSEPIHATGWTYPIGTIGGFGMGLRVWAEQLDEIAAEDSDTAR